MPSAETQVLDGARVEQHLVLLHSQTPRPSLRVEAATSTNAVQLPDDINTTTRPDAKDILQIFFSPCNVYSSRAQLHTPNTLRSLYLSTKSRSQLVHLDLSAIISFFGSLSILSEGQSNGSIYMHPLSLKFHGPQSRTYWPFILQIARDKEQLVGSLDVQDRYWVMRAHLAKLLSGGASYCEMIVSFFLLNLGLIFF
jgi:hypothetical protein